MGHASAWNEALNFVRQFSYHKAKSCSEFVSPPRRQEGRAAALSVMIPKNSGNVWSAEPLPLLMKTERFEHKGMRASKMRQSLLFRKNGCAAKAACTWMLN